MTASLLVSARVHASHRARIDAIVAAAPRPISVVPFTGDLTLSDDAVAAIEAAYFSRDIWEGSTRREPSAAAAAFWSIVDRAPNLRWIQVVSAGADMPQYVNVMRRGVALTTSSGANAAPVALSALAGLLALARGMHHWWAAQARREWSPLLGPAMPPDLPGQSALIVGMGPIGAHIARYLQALGVRTVGVRRRPAPAAGFDAVVGLDALDAELPRCDWLVLACPLAPETRGLLDARRIALMPAHAGVVNIARGEVIVETDLIEALRAGRLRGAYLDVFHTEPLPSTSPLWTLPNVILSPHNAAASPGNLGRGVEIFLDNLARWLDGRPLVNRATT